MPKPASIPLILVIFVTVFVTGLVQAQEPDTVKTVMALDVHDTTRVNMLFAAGRELWFARKMSAAAHALKHAVNLGEVSKHRVHHADALNLLANIYTQQQDFDSAFHFLQRAQSENDKRFDGHIKETYSRLYFHLGDYPSSLHYALAAADNYESNTDPAFNLQSIFTYVLAGDILDKQGQIEKAFGYYQKAYTKSKTARVNWYIKTPIQKIAHYYYLKGDLEKARHLYDTIIAIDTDAPSLSPTMYSHEGLGLIALKELDFKRAIRHFKTAMWYAEQKGLEIDQANFASFLGSAFMAAGQFDSAKHYLQWSAKESAQSGNYANLTQTYRRLSTLSEKKRDHAAALQYHKLYKAFEDSVLNIEKVRAVNNLEVLYRTRQKENEIRELQAADIDKSFEIRRRNIYTGIAATLVVALGVIILLIRRNYRTRQRWNEQRVQQMEQQQQLISLQSMINGQETERIRVARDLHDELGTLFSTVKMNFSVLQHELPGLRDNPLFQKSYHLADTASVEVRRIAHNMMPEVLMKLGVVNAIRDLCDNLTFGKKLDVSFEVYGMDKRLNSAMEIMLYRIVQELLNNIVKHADATEIIIQLTKDENRLSVVVEDNGKGFDPDHADLQTHSGLQTIRNRVDYLGGKLTIDSQKNVGTTIMMDFVITETNGALKLK